MLYYYVGILISIIRVNRKRMFRPFHPRQIYIDINKSYSLISMQKNKSTDQGIQPPFINHLATNASSLSILLR